MITALTALLVLISLGLVVTVPSFSYTREWKVQKVTLQRYPSLDIPCSCNCWLLTVFQHI
jgi:hypothetical protein